MFQRICFNYLFSKDSDYIQVFQGRVMILKVSKIYLFVLLNMEYKESYQRR